MLPLWAAFLPKASPRMLDTSLFHLSSPRQGSCLSCLPLCPQCMVQHSASVGKHLLNESVFSGLQLPALTQPVCLLTSPVVINNSGCKNVWPELFVKCFETCFKNVSEIWFGFQLYHLVTGVNPPTVLNLIFLIDKVGMKIIIWTMWRLVINSSLLNALQCFSL